jgi:choline kinase
MKTKIFLMCAGKGVRWGIKTPKHIAIVNGEQNIKRTIRLIKEHGIKEEPYVIINELHKSFFDTSLNLVIGSFKREIDRFRNAYPYFDNCERVIFLYGDVIYKEDDLKKILDGYNNCFFGRKDRNPLTKKMYGELFGLVVIDKEKFILDIKQIVEKFDKGLIEREIGWSVYNEFENDYQFEELSYYTDDYDNYKEYQQILKLYK